MVDEDDPDVYGDQLQESYFSIGCAIMTPNNNRIHLLGEMIDDYHVDGVVEMILSGLSFCGNGIHQCEEFRE